MEITSALESYFTLRGAKKDLEDQLQSVGDPVGIESEISRLQKEVDELKTKLTIKLSDEDEAQDILLKEEFEK